MIDLSTAYKMIEGLPLGEIVAISMEEERILASSQSVEELLEKLNGWDNAKPPLFLTVADPAVAWIL